MPIALGKPVAAALQIAKLPALTADLPLETCQICIVIPVRNEAEQLPAMIKALAHQVDAQGNPVDRDSYEILLLANNCSDRSAAIARALSQTYPALRLQVIETTLPAAQAHIGYARQLVMNEAYRRLTLRGGDRRIIASTDGDTEVSATWVAALKTEFDQGAEVVCGRILTRRAAEGIPTATSLYFLRYMAHRHLSAQLEALLDPLPHDRWPRHYQHFGGNLAVLATLYGRVGGIPDVENQEDVALYRQLLQADAKIRHSPAVRVRTSARRVGRTSGGLAERLNQLSQASHQRQAIAVESPQLTEARILTRNQLRQTWTAQNSRSGSEFWRQAGIRLLSKRLGMGEIQLRQAIETAPTFGLLLERLADQQRQHIDVAGWQRAATEISLANMYLRQRVQALRPQAHASPRLEPRLSGYGRLEPLEQVQPIPLFSLTD